MFLLYFWNMKVFEFWKFNKCIFTQNNYIWGICFHKLICLLPIAVFGLFNG